MTGFGLSEHYCWLERCYRWYIWDRLDSRYILQFCVLILIDAHQIFRLLLRSLILAFSSVVQGRQLSSWDSFLSEEFSCVVLSNLSNLPLTSLSIAVKLVICPLRGYIRCKIFTFFLGAVKWVAESDFWISTRSTFCTANILL